MAKPKIVKAPETGTGATPAPAAADGKKRARANHELLDSAGVVVEDEELATGIRYTHLASGASIDWQSGMSPGSAQTMLVCFGAKTLATNEASQVKQKEGDETNPVDAIRERFDLIASGKWVDRTGGVGAKVNLEVLSQAICEVLNASDAVKSGKQPPRVPAEVQKALEADKSKQTTARANPEIATAYTRLMGRTVKTVDDVFASL